MRKSNLVFFSNVYILNGCGKLSDSKFMEQVIDPGAIDAIVEHKRKTGGIVRLSPHQEEIKRNYMPCSYSNGDFTHGAIKEEGKVVYVNKCENTACEFFAKCSRESNFRHIQRDKDATFDFVSNQREKEIEIEFDINLPDPEVAKNVFVKKLTTENLKLTATNQTFNEIERNYKAREWNVRSFERHYKDGKVVYICGHKRKHAKDKTIAVKTNRKILKRCGVLKKSFINLSFIKKQTQTSVENFIESKISNPTGYQLKNIKPIDSAEVIVKSDIESKILVNAGPGTGKTHTVIERLKYIVNECCNINPEDVLVLCFSRSAVKVIRDRLNKAIEEKGISYAAKRFNILTFDSFATWYIKQIEPEFDLSPYDYDERIELFISKYEKDPQVLGVNYLIVDEIQDLVGKRAKMVQSLLQHIKCGFLLLGDECQAIFDYQINNSKEFNASKLYQWLEETFNNNLLEYEFTKEWRHQGGLEGAFKSLRSAMQTQPYLTQRDQLEKLFVDYDIPELNTEDIIYCYDNSGGKKAILSWSNGDAYRQSQELFARDDINITHTVLTGNRKLLFRKELALILSSFQCDTVMKTEFYVKGEKIGVEEKTLNKIWNAILFTLEKDSNSNSFFLPDFKRALLSEKGVDDELTIQNEADLVISTIHKAKGKEYDTVVLNKFGSVSNTDDIKVYYVALTRTKKELFVKTKTRSLFYDKKTDKGRFFEIGNYCRIKRVELGLDGDVDPVGFVDKKLSGFTPEKRQEYIANNIKIGDPIRISRHQNEYLITHQGHVIGYANKNIFKKHKYHDRNGFKEFNLEKYTDYVDLFVKDVVSIVNQRLDERIPEPYKGSGFWLGIEFCGYAKPMEE